MHKHNYMEIWKDIKGYEGYYKVSTLGNIKRVVSKNRPKELIRKIVYKKNGYATVLLSVKQKVKLIHVHRAVANSFIPNPENKPQVNHKDLNKKNNNISNLEWMTNLENMQHVNSIKKWSNNARSGKENARSIPVIQLSIDGIKIKEWVNMSQAALALGIGNGDICNVCKGNRKSAGGYKWEYLHISHNHISKIQSPLNAIKL